MPALKSSSSADHEAVLNPGDAQELARLLNIVLRHDPKGSEIQSILEAATRQSESGREQGDRAVLVGKARAVFAERRRRAEYFSRIMFSEPGWDMLLALYISDFVGSRQTIGKLINWIGAPQSTALRWVQYLEKEKLVEREYHPWDRRTHFLTLTEKGRRILGEYLNTLPNSLSSV